MRALFLTAAEARDYFKDADDYARLLPLENLEMICPRNPTLEGYQKLFLGSFRSFTSEEKNTLLSRLSPVDFIDSEIKFVKTSHAHSLDIPQTRKDVILVPGGFMGQATLIHEVYHVLSRANPELTETLAKLWGFEKIEAEQIQDPGFLLNPDALFSNFAITTTHSATGNSIRVAPYIGRGFRPYLKVVGAEHYIPASETDYPDRITNTSYIAHPEEICAEYFALSLLGLCIFQKGELDRPGIQRYFEELKLILSKLGLNKGLSLKVGAAR